MNFRNAGTSAAGSSRVNMESSIDSNFTSAAANSAIKPPQLANTTQSHNAKASETNVNPLQDPDYVE